MGANSFPNGGQKPTSSRGLALVPVVSLLVVAAFVWPRATDPEEVPLPQPDSRALERVKADEKARIAQVHGVLSPYLLTVGTAFRSFLHLETEKATTAEAETARRALDTAVREAAAADGAPGLLTLRAVQLTRFLDAVQAFEASGKPSEELLDLGGNFVQRMRDVGWIQGHQVLLPEDARRAAYKVMWNQTLGLEKAPEFALTLDESRALYGFYISHPIADSRRTESFATRRKEAKDARQCQDIAVAENTAREAWRIDKIKRLGAIDPDYPLQLALGVAQFRSHNYPASVEAFRTYQRGHEEGPYAALVQGYMRAAMREAELGD
jgi:hypothetical protein